MKRQRLRVVPIESGTPAKINTDEIPDYVGDNLAQAVLEALRRCMKNPQFMEDYRRWEIEYDRRNAASGKQRDSGGDSRPDIDGQPELPGDASDALRHRETPVTAGIENRNDVGASALAGAGY